MGIVLKGKGYITQLDPADTQMMVINLRPVLVVVGVIAALLGLVWMLQGIGILPGSVMSGSQFWAVAGAVTFLIGLAIAGAGFRTKK